jgi:hypothetical protein
LSRQSHSRHERDRTMAAAVAKVRLCQDSRRRPGDGVIDQHVCRLHVRSPSWCGDGLSTLVATMWWSSSPSSSRSTDGQLSARVMRCVVRAGGLRRVKGERVAVFNRGWRSIERGNGWRRCSGEWSGEPGGGARGAWRACSGYKYLAMFVLGVPRGTDWTRSPIHNQPKMTVDETFSLIFFL